MQALVHFTIGLSGALVALVFVDWPARQEFVVVFVSGLWAMVPDVHWLFREFGLERAAIVGKAFHRSPYANVFWFHQIVDSLETGRRNLEAGGSLVILFAVVIMYFFFNDWTAP